MFQQCVGNKSLAYSVKYLIFSHGLQFKPLFQVNKRIQNCLDAEALWQVPGDHSQEGTNR